MSKSRDTADLVTGIDVDSSGNVGIGTASPITVRSTNLTIAGSASSGLYLEDTGYEASGDGLCELTYDDGALIHRTGSRSGTGITGATEHHRFDSDGLKFNGDTAAANALNDYEEGSWTPAINSGTVTVQDNRYTKIGNTVILKAYLSSWSDTTSATPIAVTGLPFAPNSSNRGVGAVMPRYVTKTSHTQMVAHISSASTVTFYMSRFDTLASWHDVEYADLNSTGDIIFTVVYETDS